MEKRINAYSKRQNALKGLYGLGMYRAKSPVERSVLNLIYYRVSQINGYA